MFVISSTLRTPKKSEMALSNQVREATDQAASALREALAFAARTEHPLIINSLTDILMRLESLDTIEDLMDKIGKPKEIPRSF